MALMNTALHGHSNRKSQFPGQVEKYQQQLPPIGPLPYIDPNASPDIKTFKLTLSGEFVSSFEPITRALDSHHEA
jgi:hypothetical protein